MSASIVGKLRVMLGLDTSEFKKGANGVGPQIAQMRSQFLAISAAAAGLSVALGGIALRGARAIDDTAKAARRLDGSVAGYRALEMAADDAGVSLSSLANDVQTMNREISKNSKGAQTALAQLGLTAADLSELDVDQKMALIGDRVKDLGLDSAQTSALLQGLGIRNREMALLMVQGGDALRAARTDVQEFGLALSDVDAAAIERANDQIAGLGDISTYVGDQLALRLVPGLGAMADAMTNSLREGGLLRSVIDGLIGNLDVIAGSLAVATTGFGVRYVAALALANLSTITLAGSLGLLRTALITTGIGALVVGAGYLVAKFADLVRGAGGFGSAMGLLKDVAAEVWDRIRRGASLMAEAIAGSAMSINAAFSGAFAGVVESFASMTSAIASGWNGLMGMMGIESNAQGMGANLAAGMRAQADALSSSAQAFNSSISSSFSEISGPLQSVAALKGAVEGTTESIEQATVAANELGGALEEAGGGGGAGSGKGGKALDNLKEKTSELKNEMSEVESTFETAFVSIVTGAKSAREALSELLKSFATMLAQRAFQGLAGSLFSGLGGGGGLFGGNSWGAPSFDGGGFTGSGARSGGLDGKGGFMAMLHPNETVIDHTRGQGGGASVTIHVDARGAVEGVPAQIEAALRRAAPDLERGIIQAIQSKRGRGVAV